MTDAPIQIRKTEVVKAIRRLADLRGQSITEVVSEAVQTALRDADQSKDRAIEERLRRGQEIVASLQRLPRSAPLLTDDELYGEDGLPREA